jgi:hypothetical protein
MPIETSQAAATLAYKRWRAPQSVDRRVDSLARLIRGKVAALPPLSDEQLNKLADAVAGEPR